MNKILAGRSIVAIMDWGDDLTGIKKGEIYKIIGTLRVTKGRLQRCYRIKYRGVNVDVPCSLFSEPVDTNLVEIPEYGMF